MSRLIDAEKLRADFLGMPNCYNGFSDTYDKAIIVDMVDEQPTIDAVPVVRCKDCKHMFTDFVMDGKEYKRCEMQMAGFHDDWYCADGERKDNETD